MLLALPYSGWDVVQRAQRAGRFLKLSASEFVTWKLRMAVEEGLLAPAPVDTVVLPDGFSAETEAVWDGFVFLLACRWLHTPGEPAPYTREFAAPWCGVSVWQAKGAITELKRAGFMLPSGKHRRMTLWLPRTPVA